MRKFFSFVAAALFAGSMFAQTTVTWVPTEADVNALVSGETHSVVVGTGANSFEVRAARPWSGDASTVKLEWAAPGIKMTDNAMLKAGIAVWVGEDGNDIANIEFYAHQTNTRKAYYYAGTELAGQTGAVTAEALAKTSTAYSPWDVESFERETYYVFGGKSGGSGDSYYDSIKVTFTDRVLPTDVATLKGIKVAGEAIADFDAATLTYDVELAYGTTVVPTVTATPTYSNETVTVTPATALPGATTIAVVSADETVTTTYTVNFTVAAEASHDADLKSLKIDGTAVKGFKADSIEYAFEVAYAQEALPVVAAEVNEEHATLVINQITEYPSAATVVVTAQDGTTTKTYTINFTKATAPKNLNQAVMSNGYTAWWSADDAEHTLHAYYLAGAEEPTLVDSTIVVNEGASYEITASGIVVTGADQTTLTYPLAVEAVTPAQFTTDTVVFDGTEEYIKGGYGFDASKKWRFSKTDTDYSRERNGKTHIELFLPACETISFLESCGQTRDIKLYINGEQFGEAVKQVKNGWSTFNVAQDAPFMLSIVSAQTGGDGGIAAMVMTAKSTAVAEMSAAKATKAIINGQVVILRQGKVYNVLGGLR